MSVIRFPFAMMLFSAFLLSCLIVGAVSPFGALSGFFGALLISFSTRIGD